MADSNNRFLHIKSLSLQTHWSHLLVPRISFVTSFKFSVKAILASMNRND